MWATQGMAFHKYHFYDNAVVKEDWAVFRFLQVNQWLMWLAEAESEEEEEDDGDN